MAYGFIESSVIRDALTNRVAEPDTLKECLDLMCDYIVDDMMDGQVSYEVWKARDKALHRALRAYDRGYYGVCLVYIDDYFAI
jgi:hypothetical protein